MAVRPKGSCDGGLVHSLRRQSVNGLKRRSHLFGCALARNFALQPQARQWRQGLLRRRNTLNNLRVTVEYSKNDVSEVLQRVIAVRHLHRVRSQAFDSVGVLATVVVAYHLHARILFEPNCERLGAPA